jgi:hypothetical protein
MKTNLLLICAYLLISCSETPSIEDAQQLNGFWEIKKAVTPYEEKEYDANQLIDYFEVNDSLGFRKKLQPNVLGNYQSSKNREVFKIHRREDALLLVYENSYDQWTEELIRISSNEFTVKNEEGFTYTYEKYETSKQDLNHEE